jgi:hypothetical protein
MLHKVIGPRGAFVYEAVKEAAENFNISSGVITP